MESKGGQLGGYMHVYVLVLVACTYVLVGSESIHPRTYIRTVVASRKKNTPSDPYYSSLIRMYLPLKCV
jgi:hypothetical protein